VGGVKGGVTAGGEGSSSGEGENGGSSE
jgi:hypothetical protein